MSKTLKNLIYIGLAVVFGQLLGGLRSFWLARLINPGDYGIWTSIQMIVSLAPIAFLGTMEALLKQVPFFRGKEDIENLRKIEGSVFGSVVLAAALVAAVFLFGHRMIPFKFIQDNLMLAQITAVTAAIGFFTAFHYYRCTAYENFKLVSVLDVLRVAFNATCILFFAWGWGLLGATFGALVGEVLSWVAFAWLSSRALGKIHVNFQFRPMAEAIRVGFPITVIWWIYAIQTSVGRMTSVSYLGNTLTGYYGVGSSVAMLFAVVPNLISRVFYPRVSAQLGAKADLPAIRQSVVVPTSAICMLLPVAQAAVFFMLPLIYTHFLPKYKEGVLCAQILILGAFFVGMIRNGANYLIAANMQVRVMKYVVISVAANALVSVSLVKLGLGINGIALAASLASALFALFIWRRVFIELGYDRSSRVKLYANFYLPFAVTLLAIVAVRFGFHTFGSDAGYSLQVQMCLVLGICAVVILGLPSTRNQLKELYARGISSVNFLRFRPPIVK